MTAAPLCETAAFQPWLIFSLPVNDHSSCQADTAAPVFVTLTAAVRPPFH